MKLMWFRRDLRVEDNTALQCAIRTGEPVVAVYVATPSQWATHHLAPIQADLIYRRLFELKKDLSELNIPLLYLEVETFSDSAAAISDLACEHSFDGVFLNTEYEVNERLRDEQLKERLAEKSVEVYSYEDKCALPPGAVKNKKGEYFKVFTPFKRAYLELHYSQPLNMSKTEQAKSHSLPEHLQQMMFNSESPFHYARISSEQWVVDTTSIIAQLRGFCQNKAIQYKDDRDIPSVEGTSKLSAYLAIGALSVRQCFARLYYQTAGRGLSLGEETWQSELVWREFYQHLIYFEPKLSKGGNFVGWAKHLQWRHSDDLHNKWVEGKTGYPIVDAAMRQLKETGWMHNRLRMITASFYTKDLRLDWRKGEAYFMSQLIDGEYAANNGGWQWCASTGCDGQPYFRIFNPVTQGERFDPQGDFVRAWVPELENIEDKYIQQPWKSVNTSALSYPQPIVDHSVERKITLAVYKEAKDHTE